MSTETPLRLVENTGEDRETRGKSIASSFDELFSYAGNRGLANIHRVTIELSDALPERSQEQPALATEWFPSLRGEQEFRLVLVRRRIIRFRKFGLIESRSIDNPSKTQRVAGVYPDGYVFNPHLSYDQVERSTGYRIVTDPNKLDEIDLALESFRAHLA